MTNIKQISLLRGISFKPWKYGLLWIRYFKVTHICSVHREVFTALPDGPFRVNAFHMIMFIFVFLARMNTLLMIFNKNQIIPFLSHETSTFPFCLAKVIFPPLVRWQPVWALENRSLSLQPEWHAAENDLRFISLHEGWVSPRKSGKRPGSQHGHPFNS